MFLPPLGGAEPDRLERVGYPAGRAVGHSGVVDLPSPTAPAEPAPRPPTNRADPRAPRWWTTRALLELAVPLAVQLVALLVAGSGWLVATLAATAVLGAVYVVVMPRWRYRVHRWEADDRAVYTLSGWLRLEWRVAPVPRIQTIDTAIGPLQRLFGLATVTVTTASSAGPVRIEGLDGDDAARLARRLTEITQGHPGDAT